MNPTDFSQRIQDLEQQKLKLQQEIVSLEEEIKEINLSNQMEINSFADQVELEEVDNQPETVPESNYTVSTKVPEIKPETINSELEKIFKL